MGLKRFYLALALLFLSQALFCKAQVSQELIAAANNAVNAAQASLAAAQAVQQQVMALQQQPQQPQQPQPIPAVAAVPGPIPQQQQQQQQQPAPAAAGSTFAAPGFEKPLAGTQMGSAPPLRGLQSPSSEVAAVLGEQQGVPAGAIPQGLPERLNASLQGQQPLVQGSSGGGGGGSGS